LLNPPTANREPKRDHSREEANPPGRLPIATFLAITDPVKHKSKTGKRDGKMHRNGMEYQDGI
jgi:hypothetical protein